jgi:hypothetical protein
MLALMQSSCEIFVEDSIWDFGLAAMAKVLGGGLSLGPGLGRDLFDSNCLPEEILPEASLYLCS